MLLNNVLQIVLCGIAGLDGMRTPALHLARIWYVSLEMLHGAWCRLCLHAQYHPPEASTVVMVA